MKKLIIFVTFLINVARELEALTCDEIRAFVDGHNERRLRLARGEVRRQPAASDMTYMIWDRELAEKAKRFAATFPEDHNPDTSVPSGRFETGENLFWLSTTDTDFKLEPQSALDSWWTEHKHYTYRPLEDSDFDNSKPHQIGHYTQMAWAETMFIGCGIASKNRRERKLFYVVCNYGPPGNYLGEYPYKRGKKQRQLKCECQKYDDNCSCDRRYGRKCSSE